MLWGKFKKEMDKNCDERFLAARKSTLVSVLVNLFLTSGQVIAGIFSGSQGLIADGIHSLSDLVSDFVVLVANHKSKKNPDRDHHYGHYRYENGASLILGVILLLVGIGMLWSATNKMQYPGDIPQVHPLALWVALSALAVKELLFRYMLAVATRVKSSMLIANAWHARSDAASSLVVAVGIIGNLSGFKFLDPIAAVVVGLIVSRMGYSFMSDSLHDLMDRSVDTETEGKIKTTLLATPGVDGIHDLKTRKMGDLVMVDVHLEIDGDLSVKDGHDIAVIARRSVLENHHVLNVMTHVDPSSRDYHRPCSGILTDNFSQ
ncbi:cation transporter [Salmonella enterica subsp. enterica serovar Newport]|nr:cation transporter [Salmonella enterica subsp. enterica serovar Newport]MJR82404.1 cation transporter [Salmonella enterica subsp. enterica serovar Newport]HAE2415354.1 cation transporter [Salmonella enterica subsp. enterica serovar Newport]